MADRKRTPLRRDRRLLVSLGFFVVSFAALAYQAFVLRLYVTAAVMGDWTYFSKTFSVPPPSGPNQLCFDYCAARLPFLAGWIGIFSFLLGVAVLAYCWWKPRSPDYQ